MPLKERQTANHKESPRFLLAIVGLDDPSPNPKHDWVRSKRHLKVLRPRLQLPGGTAPERCCTAARSKAAGSPLRCSGRSTWVRTRHGTRPGQGTQGFLGQPTTTCDRCERCGGMTPRETIQVVVSFEGIPRLIPSFPPQKWTPHFGHQNSLPIQSSGPKK